MCVVQTAYMDRVATKKIGFKPTLRVSSKNIHFVWVTTEYEHDNRIKTAALTTAATKPLTLLIRSMCCSTRLY